MFERWVGIDLDSTLAFRDHSVGYNPMTIGSIIPKAKELLLRLIEQGKRENFVVKIFTARACENRTIPIIKQWLKENGLPDLEITNVKDYGCIMLIDDIANQMIANTGVLISSYYLDLIRERDDLLQEILQEFYSQKGVSFATIDKVKEFGIRRV